MRRRDNWAERLHVAMLSIQAAPFAWGVHDCLLTAADLIEAMTDVDPAADFRGKYASQTDALRLVAANGCNSFEDLAAKIVASHGMTEIRPPFAQRGDLVLADDQHGVGFGIVDLNGRDFIAISPEGLRRVPLESARRAWRVG